VGVAAEAFVDVALADATTSHGGDLDARWTCTGRPGEGCAEPFTVTGGTGKFSKAMGANQFVLRSKVMEVVTTVPERDVTGTFTGPACGER
jgi:hypothetical protein